MMNKHPKRLDPVTKSAKIPQQKMSPFVPAGKFLTKEGDVKKPSTKK